MIPEPERRWDDWQGGRPIELPDGQTWWFYAPEPRVRAGVPGWTFGPEVAPDVDAILSNRLGRILAKWGRAGDDADRASTLLEAAWFLLGRNYRLTPEEFAAIMAGASGWDAAQHERFAAEIAALIGQACARSSALLEVA